MASLYYRGTHANCRIVARCCANLQLYPGPGTNIGAGRFVTQPGTFTYDSGRKINPGWTSVPTRDMRQVTATGDDWAVLVTDPSQTAWNNVPVREARLTSAQIAAFAPLFAACIPLDATWSGATVSDEDQLQDPVPSTTPHVGVIRWDSWVTYKVINGEFLGGEDRDLFGADIVTDSTLGKYGYMQPSLANVGAFWILGGNISLSTAQARMDAEINALADAGIDHMVFDWYQKPSEIVTCHTRCNARHTSATSPPALTMTGDLSTPGLSRLRIEIPTEGARGTATFRYSLDDGASWSSAIATAATYALPNSVTLNFAAGTYKTDHEYWAAPFWSEYRTALELYKTSAYKHRIKYALILIRKWAGWPWAAWPLNVDNDETWDNFTSYTTAWLQEFADPQYLKTDVDRPVVGLFGGAGDSGWVSLGARIDQIAVAAVNAGFGAPYFATFNVAAASVASMGAHAVTSYGPLGAQPPGGPQIAWTAQVAVDEAAWAPLGSSIDNIYQLTPCGDGRPRGHTWYVDRPTYSQWEDHVQGAVDALNGNPFRSKQLIWIYAWNETGEGGDFAPTAQEGSKYIDAVRNVLAATPPSAYWDQYAADTLHTAMVRTGTWARTASYTGAFNYTEMRSTTTNDQIALTPPQNVTGFEVRGTKGPDRGIVQIDIDDVATATVDLYAASATKNAVIYTTSALSAASHKIEVIVTGTKNASSSAVTIGIDELRAKVSR